MNHDWLAIWISGASVIANMAAIWINIRVRRMLEGS